jgi:hypothetical protein
VAEIPVTELDLWHQVLVTREECDAAAGITDPATVNARAACEAVANGGQS